MSIEQFDEVDSVNLDPCGTICRLTIVDHLPWDQSHLEALQKKINHYLQWIESGTYYLQHPQLAGCEFCIDILAIFEPDEAASAFIAQAKTVLEAAGFELAIKPYASEYAALPH